MTTFTIRPGEPPEVRLTPGGGAGYPGVVLKSTDGTPLGTQRITVTLPEDAGLRWGTADAPDAELTVLAGRAYRGQLSADGMSVSFDDVALDVPSGGTVVMWINVAATTGASTGATSLTYTVGAEECRSTMVNVAES